MDNFKFNMRDKIEIYRYLMKNGFEPLDYDKLQSSFPEFKIEEIKNLLEAYKTSSKKSLLKDWTLKILELRLNYKHDYFNSIFSDVISKKAFTFPENSDYRQVYLFLAQLLRGEIPDIENISESSMSILLILIQEMQLLVDSIDTNDFNDLFKLNPTNEIVNTDDEYENNNSSIRSKQLLETLSSMFKFQKISDFMNPLNLPLEVNEKLLEHFLKTWDH